MDKHREFWNREYQTSEHLALSDEPAEDLQKFTRFLERNTKREFLNPTCKALDLGCGNGRHLIYLAESFGMPGIGYDISDIAIKEAMRVSGDLPIHYEIRSIADPLPQGDGTVTLVLDMMTSHFLRRKEREKLKDEILRVLRPGGWFFFKSFLADEDINVRRLLREHPADEENAYIHPTMGVYEYVWTEDTLYDFFTPEFEIHKTLKSHKHLKRGRAGKRRTISAYMQKF
ncbi:MAG TPA: class I SAM-dependent methyltransferase [Candidatus Paceibacterota bacterium]|nr:class I SAM-dependent methyltransferase [Candidatus Paceibacterota bacterium]